MKKITKEAEILEPQPVDKIDKNLRHIFGLLVEKDWKMAGNLVDLMKKGDEASQQLAEGFTQLIDFLRVFSAGKETRSAMRDVSSLTLNNDIERLLPEMGEEDREKLKEDIESKGILAPLIVQETSNGLELIDGYTRYRIAEELGIKRVPVVSVSPMLDSRMLALTLNLLRRHMTKDERANYIKQLPIPKRGRPKKGEKTISRKELAKELAISESTVARARQKKNVSFDTFSKPKISEPKKTKTNEIQWLNEKDIELFREVGYLKGIGYYFDFTPDQIDLDLMVRQIDKGMTQLTKAIKDAGLESQVDHYSMHVTFEARKKGA